MLLYACIYDTWTEETKELTDAEKGRLIDAVMLYFTGREYEHKLTGNERYLFPTFQTRIDRNKQAYDEKCAKNTENIRKRWNRDTETETEPGDDTTVYDGIRTYTNDTKRKENNQKESKINKNNQNQSNQKDRVCVYERAEKTGLLRSEADRAKLDDLIDRYGTGRTDAAISETVKHEGKTIEYVQRVIETQRPAQAFSQRSYQDDADPMEEAMRNIDVKNTIETLEGDEQ